MPATSSGKKRRRSMRRSSATRSSGREDRRRENRIMSVTATLTYHVFVSDPPAHGNGVLPNGELKGGSPVASTLICGSKDAVLTDPAFTRDQAQALGDW